MIRKAIILGLIVLQVAVAQVEKTVYIAPALTHRMRLSERRKIIKALETAFTAYEKVDVVKGVEAESRFSRCGLETMEGCHDAICIADRTTCLKADIGVLAEFRRNEEGILVRVLSADALKGNKVTTLERFFDGSFESVLSRGIREIAADVLGDTTYRADTAAAGDGVMVVREVVRNRRIERQFLMLGVAGGAVVATAVVFGVTALIGLLTKDEPGSEQSDVTVQW